MKKHLFNMAASALLLVIIAGIYFNVLAGEGLLKMLEYKTAAADADISYTPIMPPTGTVDTYSGGPIEITEETLSYICIDGIRYDFPLHINLLPDEYEAVKSSIYNNDYMMYYLYRDGICFMMGSQKSNPDGSFDMQDVTLDFICCDSLSDKSTGHLPQVTFGPFDAGTITASQALSAFTGDSVKPNGDYGYTSFYVPANGGKDSVALEVSKNGGVAALRYRHDVPYVRALGGMLLEADSICLPEYYSIETDTANKALSYEQLPEKNDEMKKLLNGVYFIRDDERVKLTLPCTLNALISSVSGENGRANALDCEELEDSELFGLTGNVGRCRFQAVMTPGEALGDAVFVEISSFSTASAPHILEVEGITIEENEPRSSEYSFTVNPDGVYMLTDYEYNNYTYGKSLTGERYEMRICYRPDNLKKAG